MSAHSGFGQHRTTVTVIYMKTCVCALRSDWVGNSPPVEFPRGESPAEGFTGHSQRSNSGGTRLICSAVRTFSNLLNLKIGIHMAFTKSNLDRHAKGSSESKSDLKRVAARLLIC